MLFNVFYNSNEFTPFGVGAGMSGASQSIVRLLGPLKLYYGFCGENIFDQIWLIILYLYFILMINI